MANQALFNPSAMIAMRGQLEGRLINLCFGAGVDSTAMMIALKVAGITPDLLTFADTGGEKAETYRHLDRMQEVMKKWGWPEISVVKKKTLDSTGYDDLYGNCIQNETLPSLAFGLKSCSLKWKSGVQDNFLKGVNRGPNKQPAHPVWIEAKETGQRIVKLIGYDCGKADLKRSSKIIKDDPHFDFYYPLQTLGWTRTECVEAIVTVLGEDYVPVKSACFFCPASKEWELYWLAAKEPDLLERALIMERVALTGKHSRFDELATGKQWEEMVRSGDRFPSTTTTVGLGRSFSWNQWAVQNGVVDADFNVIRSPDMTLHFMSKANELRTDDNAYDNRGKKVIPIAKQENVWA